MKTYILMNNETNPNTAEDIKVNGNRVTFTNNEKSITTSLVKKYKAQTGAGVDERYVVKLDLTFSFKSPTIFASKYNSPESLLIKLDSYWSTLLSDISIFHNCSIILNLKLSVLSFMILVKIFPRFASNAPFLCFILDHLE